MRDKVDFPQLHLDPITRQQNFSKVIRDGLSQLIQLHPDILCLKLDNDIFFKPSAKSVANLAPSGVH